MPRRTRGRVLFGPPSLEPGFSWYAEIEQAIGQAKAVAVFLGKNGLGTWQKREMEYAMARQAQEERADRSRLRVIPVLLPGADLDHAPAMLLLNTFVDLRRRLDDSVALEALVRSVHGEAAAAVDPAAKVEALCPYRDLRVFREEDAPRLLRRGVRRDAQAAGPESAAGALVGPSGSGKSSVVQAGLLPLLRREHPPSLTWDALIFRPGDRPFHNLAKGLVPILEPGCDELSRLAKEQEFGRAVADCCRCIQGRLRASRRAGEVTGHKPLGSSWSINLRNSSHWLRRRISGRSSHSCSKWPIACPSRSWLP